MKRTPQKNKETDFTYTPTQARKDFYLIVRDVESSGAIYRVKHRKGSAAVILSEEKYNRLIRSQKEKQPPEAKEDFPETVALLEKMIKDANPSARMKPSDTRRENIYAQHLKEKYGDLL